MKEFMRQKIVSALQSCFENNTLNSGEIPDIQVEIPANPEHGDFSSNVAMMMAKKEKKAPVQIAKALVQAFSENIFIEKLDIAGPGFINFTMSRRYWYEVLEKVSSSGEQYGCSNIGQGQKIQVEFVSANPTGPLHIGHGRGAAVGDAVASILQANGYDVQREYYVNDAGNQVETLGRSIWLRLRELQGHKIVFPEDGYQGQYVRGLALQLHKEEPAVIDLSEENAIKRCASFGVGKILEWISSDLEAFGVVFDNWFSEQSLYDRNMVETELAKLAQKGLSYQEDLALWLKTTEYGDDKDRVLIKSDGAPTYFASDVAYHMEKFDRGFQRVIDVWGADHHGYVPRMKAVIAGLGHPPEALQVLLIQMVNLLRDGKPFTMGKRSGNFITLREVVDEVGKDASRFFFLMRRSDSQLDFDLELAKRQSNDNPVYYVQYVHARICSIKRTAKENGLSVPEFHKVDFSHLALPEELALIKKLARFPDVVFGAAQHCEPHRIVYYLQELAAQFHSYYNRHRVLVEKHELSAARLYLVSSIQTVVANALNLLGVTAPERM